MNTGWICPRCKASNAPYKTTCDCTAKFKEETHHGLKPIQPDNPWATKLPHGVYAPAREWSAVGGCPDHTVTIP